jgi:PAS domain S-box-containing protein
VTNFTYSLEDAGVLVLVADRSGQLVYHNRTASTWLGLARQSAPRLWQVTDHDSAERLLSSEYWLSPEQRPAGNEARPPETLVLRRRDGELVPITASVSLAPDAANRPLLCIFGVDDTASRVHVKNLERVTEMLNGFIDASTEAMWCIEYTEPVCLTTSEPEIVRQVFENDCHWSMCNRAMARLYGLPEDLDFNRQRVSSYFRRNPENEAFVRQLIETDFRVDSVPSTDVRHDGTLMYVENRVRCNIHDGKMLSMWGTVRDTTEFRAAQNRIAQREREVREILAAMPDAVVVINKSKCVLAVNPAFELTFGWRPDEVLGKDASGIIDLESRRQPHTPRWFAGTQQRWITNITRSDGELLPCDVRIAPLQDDEYQRFVLSLRPELSKSARNRRRAARGEPRKMLGCE